MGFKISVIVPVYNERATVLEILNRLVAVQELGGGQAEFIVVDDGSTDGTRGLLSGSRYFSDERFKFIFHEKNAGKGSAIRTGLKQASGVYTIIQDADLEYDPRDIVRLLEYAEKDNLPVVFGSRNLSLGGNRGTFAFYWGGRFVTLISNWLYGQKLTDEPTCYKLCKTDLLKSLPLTCQKFDFCPELTALVSKAGINIPEVPISYEPRDKQEGKKINWKDGISALWTLFRLRIAVNNSFFLAGLLFLFIFSWYFLTWGPIYMGYESETAQSAIDLAGGDYQIFRAGLGAVLMYLPFVALGKVLAAGSLFNFLTFVPVFYSALIAGIVFFVVLKFTAKRSHALLVAVLIAVASQLWPYSRVGMEYQLTLLLALLMLSLMAWKEHSSSLLYSGLILGWIILTKSYGALLAIPVIIFVLAVLGRRHELKSIFSPRVYLPLVTPSVIAVFLVSGLNFFIFGKFSGAYSLANEFQVWSWWEGFFGIFFSFGKSIFLFNPLLILALFYWPRFYRLHKEASWLILGIFAVLLLVTAPFSYWSDETFGVRKLVPVIILLHLPLVFAVEDFFRRGWFYKSLAAVFVAAALYIQMLTTLYPYWQQVVFLRPYNLDNLSIMRYNPRLSHLALGHRFFLSFVSHKLGGPSGHFYYLERSWMRCCTGYPEGNAVITRISANLQDFEKPDIFLFRTPSRGQQVKFFVPTLVVFLAFGGALLANWDNLRRHERTRKEI